MNLTDNDKEALVNKYPELKITAEKENYVIEGSFEFSAVFDDASKAYILNPSPEEQSLPVIEDSYQIEIIWPKNKSIPPIVKETGGRIPREPDSHKYGNDSLCYVGPLDNVETLSLLDFLDGPVLQFFYDQSYHKLFGSWPRGEYSHGVLGVIENYFNNLGQSSIEERCIDLLKKDIGWEVFRAILLGKKIKGHSMCICGSGKIYRQCHKEVFNGLWNLQKYIKKNSIEI